MTLPLCDRVLIVALCAYPTSVAAQDRYAPVIDKAGNYHWTYADSNGEQQDFTFVPASKIVPILSVDIHAAANGVRRYSYTIGNAATATQEIHSCSLEVALPTTVEATPMGWEPPAQPSEVVPRLSWYRIRADKDLVGIPEGREVSGFQLQSSALPGVVEFRCRGNVEKPQYPEDLPEDIELQVVQLAGRDRVAVPTLGPAIARPEDSAPVLIRRIVRNYRQPISRSNATHRTAIVRALDQAVATNVNDNDSLRVAIHQIRTLLSREEQDPWALQLFRGLGDGLEHVLSKMPEP